jgi:hypothetical protein
MHTAGNVLEVGLSVTGAFTMLYIRAICYYVSIKRISLLFFFFYA